MGSSRSRGPRSGIDIDPAVLRQARLDAGLSLAQVAGSELTRQAVHLIETGKVRPSLRSLRIIANRLGLADSVLVAHHPFDASAAEDGIVSELDRLCRRHEHGLAAERAQQAIGLGLSAQLTAFANHYAGQAYYFLSRFEDSITHSSRARELFESLANPWWAAESMDWEAMAGHGLERPGALSQARAALRRFRALEPRRPETEARMLSHIGTICYTRRDYERGRASYEAALEVTGGVRELGTIARIYHGLGMCHHGMQRLHSATEFLFKAMALYEAEQRISPMPLRSEVARVENDLGMVLMEQGSFDRAEELFRAALEHFASAGIDRAQSHVVLSLGELRQRQGRLDDALELVGRGIERAMVLNEVYAVTSGYRQLGELHAARGDRRRADESFQRALALCREAGLDERAAEYLRAYERMLSERRQARRGTRSATA